MDEAEKYQQRLEAIAEKRRQQEEQERAKREMEDEKLRLQQLKRKSLRDQWLMEGAPLSPSSLDSQSRRSPLWASQEVGKHRLLSQNAGFAGEDEKEQIAEDQTEPVDMEAGDVGTVEEDMKVIRTPSRREGSPVLINGEGDLKSGLKQHSDDAPEKPVTTNGPSESVTVEKHGQHVCHLSRTKVAEGITVMRAERVVITDDEEEVAPREHHKSTAEGGVTAEEAQVASEASTESAERETSAVEERAGSTHEETKDEDIKVEASASTGGPLEVAQVPVYSQSQPSCPPPEAPQAPGEEEAAITPASEATDASSKAQGDAVATPPPFQEVPLENHRTEARAAEEEPLVEGAKAPDAQEEAAADKSKAKICQCCSLM
ncbi:paralemmin-3 isoform X2 [Phyllopteryx taeniolatus]|nr:paralemmin-3 isoform X2 [Phyllopteryx taeniolatus]XP_061627527.1 paralemmin-3 isoform X2 [Phyllopteryx taeniolatus]XP_061627528.1 paralemmin-3 isoform X2 [Phyllopteryx taeniolatus]